MGAKSGGPGKSKTFTDLFLVFACNAKNFAITTFFSLFPSCWYFWREIRRLFSYFCPIVCDHDWSY